ncbi:hypothetical protein OG590_16715 [Streptomyces goshikiensis]|uniref:hypothetical protein n=1 Tax=Streptomyces TaxID=1883 RepID=UPI000F551182|nr:MULTISPECIES: hypothetical protein [Streptomyces]RPK47998.1 hypothetical protein EES37_10345 [Streptomyces sp. ADI91-18]WBY21404.1 hypothetical protein PET44_18390 [Streptomyces goshikiensis]WSX98759.1 hypothetical protein OG590_16715 [Streptomyces goshikiensis]
MPTPYGSRGGMAFSAAELHVLRRSLAHALQSSTAPLAAAEVSDCLRLAQTVDEAVREAGRLREFLLADLARYRGALPGSLSGYLELLQDALAAGYEPVPDDLAALRALRANAVAAALLERAQIVAERSVRRRLSTTPAPRTRLLALAGAKEENPAEAPRPEPKPAPRPAPQPAHPERPIPTPGEVFPPRRKPTPPPKAGRAAG